MTQDKLKEKIYRVLREGYFSEENDYVDVSNGYEDFIHIVVVSPKFNGCNLKIRDDLIWNEIVNSLTDDEWGTISLLIASTPDEVRIS